PPPVLGDRLELVVGPPAHGGHCVARASGLVVFVRHALPGERVVAEVTEVHRGYVRADAIRVLQASADRVVAPCPYAHPGGCGGCDLQHASAAAQREWKAAVVREQLARLAGISSDVEVRALPGGLLGWRSRVRYTVDAAGRAGLLKHRSHEVVPVERCLIAHPAIQALPVTSRTWPDESVSTVASSGGDVVIGPGTVHEHAVGREWNLPTDVFWQVHPAAPDTLASAVLELLAPGPGETAWDLYGGAGLFAAALASVGVRVTLVESAPAAVAAARANLADLPEVEVVGARVERAVRGLPRPVDLVVLDPPRAGAGASVVRAVVAAAPRAVAYVACDPAALARDAGTFREAGWRLAEVRAYDCFPMTHHVECVGLLVP
ncbi:MAG: class I SAM-dependent RNA methyltransferase, partial [Micromonosporaceae bacterium]|nr:class I SAM-dependent RNA methyltransferase [Micromonosporaceae bacterium]